MILQKLIILAGLLGALNADAALSNLDKSLVTQDNNMLTNPGFEAGKAGWENVSGAGTYTVTSTAANVYQGGAAGSWDSSSASQVFRSSLISAAGRAGGNGVASCVFKSASGTATHTMEVHDNSGNILASTSINATSSAYQRLSLNFPFGSITSARIVITSVASNEPELFIDSCFMGSAQDFNLSQVSQASFYGSLKYATTANCQWSVSSAASFTSFPADTDCPTATVTGSVTAPTTKVPGVRLQNLPAGTYQFVVTGFFQKSNAASEEYALRFFDGTNGFSQQGKIVASDSGQTSLQGFITYANAQSDITVQLQAIRNGANALLIRGDTRDFEISVYRFPSSSETAARVDTLPASWSGYHDSTCSWSRTNTSYGDPSADATCAIVEQTNRNFGTVTSYLSGSDKLPGIVFTPSRAGLFLVLVDFQAAGSAAPATQSFRLETGAGTLITEGSHVQSNNSGNYETKYSLKGVVNATSTSELTLRIQCKATSGNCQIVPAGAISTISWTIVSLDQSFPAPLLVGSVTSNSSGLERVERVMVSEDPSACSASPCTITNQSGNWVSSVTRASTGAYTVNVNAGIFSSKPSCFVTSQVGGAARWCNNNGANTTTAIPIACASNSGASIDMAFQVLCMGPR